MGEAAAKLRSKTTTKSEANICSMNAKTMYLILQRCVSILCVCVCVCVGFCVLQKFCLHKFCQQRDMLLEF